MKGIRKQSLLVAVAWVGCGNFVVSNCVAFSPHFWRDVPNAVYTHGIHFRGGVTHYFTPATNAYIQGSSIGGLICFAMLFALHRFSHRKEKRAG